MTDLISRQAAIDAIEHANGSVYWNQTLMENLVSVVKSVPTIDAVPVVRCKDCKWGWCAEPYDTYGNAPYWICKNWDGGLTTYSDGFCHEAERREDE